MRRYLLLTVSLVAFGCSSDGELPTAPSPSEVSVFFAGAEPNPLVAGEWTSVTYRLSAPRPTRVDVMVESITPAGDSLGPSTIYFDPRTVVATYSGPFDVVGDWVVRILGEELPEGVVLGSPSSLTISVVDP